MNATKPPSKDIEPIQHYYIPCSLSAGFGLIAVLICLFILFLVRRTKSRLHTVNHLLICNTCLASMFYCVVININYVYLIFIPSNTSDISCRLRAYFAYTSIAAVIYSYFIQAISRFCFSVLSSKYRWLVMYILTSIRTVYMVNLVTMSSVVALEKLFTMMLDREIRSVIRHLVTRQTLVMPFETTMQQTRHKTCLLLILICHSIEGQNLVHDTRSILEINHR